VIPLILRLIGAILDHPPFMWLARMIMIIAPFGKAREISRNQILYVDDRRQTRHSFGSSSKLIEASMIPNRSRSSCAAILRRRLS